MSEARDSFVEARRQRWRELELLLNGRPAGRDWLQLAALYRSVCADVARADSLGLAEDIRGYLDQLAGRAHNVLYGSRHVRGLGLLDTLIHGFPKELRASWRFFVAASLLFYGPLLFGFSGAMVDPDFASAVMSPQQLAGMEGAYRELSARGGTNDAMMAGFYVYNNVGIAFRCFSTGALAGLGSFFFLVYNGLVIGTMLGHLSVVGVGGNLFEFVSGHSAWELTGIVVSGTAGLRLGWSMVSTGGRTRVGSMRAAGPALYRLILGTAVMLLIAAAIEGFWSAGPAPREVKWAFGALQVLLVALWLTLGGRR
jgi:uncharacterized membrane protein SpoIIM required for sporulation